MLIACHICCNCISTCPNIQTCQFHVSYRMYLNLHITSKVYMSWGCKFKLWGHDLGGGGGGGGGGRGTRLSICIHTCTYNVYLCIICTRIIQFHTLCIYLYMHTYMYLYIYVCTHYFTIWFIIVLYYM